VVKLPLSYEVYFSSGPIIFYPNGFGRSMPDSGGDGDAALPREGGSQQLVEKNEFLFLLVLGRFIWRAVDVPQDQWFPF
jgi:hypothetical protein